MTIARRAVSLRDLLAAHDSTGLTAHHVPAHSQVVRDIALVTDVDRILTVGPDSVVLLGEELALGGWLVSVALRYAWERRAVALIVSEQSFSETVVELARRFGIALFTTARGIDNTALALARELGALEAGVLSRLDALHSRVLRATTVQEVLGQLSHELGDGLVEVMVGGVALHSAGRRPEDGDEISVPLAPGRHGQELVAWVPKAQKELAVQALARACPSIRSLLLAREVDDLMEAAPLLSSVALTGIRARGTEDASDPRAASLHRWPPGTPLMAVVLRVVDDDGDTTARLAPVVTSQWRKAFPRMPLARIQAGWFAFVPVASTPGEVLASLRRLADSALRALGVAVGMSVDAEGTERARGLLRRAWLAARLAEPDGVVVDFQRMGLPLVGRLLPPTDATEVAETAFPALVGDPHAADIIAAALAYLDCAGSVTAAAERLGVHRNTMQSRLRRAGELGLRLDDPEQLLSTHLLLAALERGTTPEPRPSTTDH